MSDSDSSSSSSSSSSDDERTSKKTSKRAVPNAAAAATAAKSVNSTAAIATAAAINAKARDIVPVQRTSAPVDGVRRFASSTKTAVAMPSTVKAKWDLVAPFQALSRQKDGGHRLRLSTAAKTLQDSDIYYSNPEHYNEESANHGAVDFATSVKVTLDHNAECALLVTTPIRATASEDAFADPSTKSTSNPYGYIAVTIPKGKTEGKWDRSTTPGTLDFMHTFPGQTETNVEQWVRAIPGSTESHVRVEPASAVAHFYNEKESDPSKHLGKATPDKYGYVYGDQVKLAEALKTTKAAIAKNIAYSNFSPKALFADIALTHKNVLNVDGKGVSKKQEPLSTAFKSNATMQSVASRIIAQNDPAEAALKIGAAHKATAATAGLDLAGDMEITYYHVDPNFKLD